MKKAVSTLMLVSFLVCVLMLPALASTFPSLPPGVQVEVDDPTPASTPTPSPSVTPTPSPSPTPVGAKPAADVLLSEVLLTGVKQSVTDPGSSNRLTLTLTFRNDGQHAVDKLLVSVAGATASSISPLQRSGPFPLWLGAGRSDSVSFQVYVPDNYMSGNFPLTLRISCTDSYGNNASAERTAFIYIDRAGDVTGVVNKGVEKPQLLVSAYDIGGGTAVNVNTKFPLTLTLTNMSQTSDIHNVKVSVISADGTFVPVDASNAEYIASIPRGGDATAVIQLKSGLKNTNTYPLQVQVEYQDAMNNTFSTVETVSVLVTNAGNIIVDTFTLPEEAIFGQPIPLNIRFGNSGDNDLKNVTLVVEGNIADSEKTVNTGDLKAGGSNYVEHSITPLAEGSQSFSISFTCYDKSGEQYTVPVQEFTVSMVKSLASPQPSTSQGQTTQPPGGLGSGNTPVIIALLAIAIIGLGVLTYIFIKNKKRNYTR